MDRILVYNHPAVPPINIKLDKGYLLEELEKEFSLDELKCFFKTENFEWDEIGTETEIVDQ